MSYKVIREKEINLRVKVDYANDALDLINKSYIKDGYINFKVQMAYKINDGRDRYVVVKIIGDSQKNVANSKVATLLIGFNRRKQFRLSMDDFNRFFYKQLSEACLGKRVWLSLLLGENIKHKLVTEMNSLILASEEQLADKLEREHMVMRLF